MWYLFTSFGVVAVKILLQWITLTRSSLQRLWHLYLICMMQIEIPNLHMKTKLSFVRFMCYFILVLTANQWLISIAFSFFFSFSLFFVAVLHWVLYMWNINCSGPRGSHFLGGFVMFLPRWWNLRKFAFPERFYGNFHFPLFYVLCLIIGNCFFLTSIWNVFISILVSKTERWSASATDFSG